ncbi:MAG: hypothetical protein GEU82_07260 [Luteitalea sp.]|nr:hypothetical protein [Luteitalea sp.]
MVIASVLWRRLDSPGHDACRLERKNGGWSLDGAAAFSHNGQPACVTYRITCDRAWHTGRGTVSGWVGSQSVGFDIERSAARAWTLNGGLVGQVDGCFDLDLGFTPATNLLQLRRLALQVGEAADVPVAWLDLEGDTLDVLHQRYERRTERTYWYEAPRFGYAALLEVSPAGFVRRYPALWEAERST